MLFGPTYGNSPFAVDIAAAPYSNDPMSTRRCSIESITRIIAKCESGEYCLVEMGDCLLRSCGLDGSAFAAKMFE